jgi:hypothetical protein
METTMMVHQKCKKCHRGVLDSRVKRALLVKVALFWLPIKRYKCNNCNKKTYLFGSSLNRRDQNTLQVIS